MHMIMHTNIKSSYITMTTGRVTWFEKWSSNPIYHINFRNWTQKPRQPLVDKKLLQHRKERNGRI